MPYSVNQENTLPQRFLVTALTHEPDFPLVPPHYCASMLPLLYHSGVVKVPPPMKETLQIRDFCGIKDASIDLAPINLFIGPQATGKSVAAKLVYFFREAISGLRTFALAQTEWKQVQHAWSLRLLSYFGVGGIGQKAFSLSYTKGTHSLTIRRKLGTNASLELDVDEFYQALYEQLLSKVQSDNPSVDSSIEAPVQLDSMAVLRRTFHAASDLELGISAAYEQFFIPAARASLALLPTQILGQIADREDIDVWMIKFANLLGSTRNLLKGSGFYHGVEATRMLSPNANVVLTEIREDIEALLRAKVEYIGDVERLRLSDDRIIPLQRGSSGQQEALPLLLTLGRFITYLHSEGRSVFIEEPEAHLWPGAQKKIVYLLARMYLRNVGRVQIVLTSHSPYVLNVLNNLLEAGRRYANLEAEPRTKANRLALATRKRRLHSIVPSTVALPPGSVAAWQFTDQGVTPLLNNEHGLIGADLLDAVSDELDEAWDRLQEVPE